MRERTTRGSCVGVSSVALPQRCVRSCSTLSSYATSVPGAPAQGASALNAKRSRAWDTSYHPPVLGEEPPVTRASRPGKESLGLVGEPSRRLTHALEYSMP